MFDQLPSAPPSSATPLSRDQPYYLTYRRGVAVEEMGIHLKNHRKTAWMLGGDGVLPRSSSAILYSCGFRAFSGVNCAGVEAFFATPRKRTPQTLCL
jgi:hypothetical protein